MSFVNYKSKELICKIIYYGPSLSGKTANIKYIADHIKESSRGKLISLKTETDRTLFFDFLPFPLGEVNGFNVRFHIYTIPGQVFYDSSKDLLLKGLDGVIFVADSTRARLEANIESMNYLIKDLHSRNLDLADIPIVMQYNKRDLESALLINEISHTLNRVNAPEYETVATQGVGVFETLKGVSKIIIANLKNEIDTNSNE